MSDEGELAAATPAPSGDAQTDSAASAETILQAKENKLSFYLPIPDIEYIAKVAATSCTLGALPACLPACLPASFAALRCVLW